MIDHLSLYVRDYATSKAFYLAALKPLGYTLVMEFGTFGGFGTSGKADFWIGSGEVTTKACHIAFVSPDRATVDTFYQAAIKAGGKDNGAPGLRPQYHADYYGAFIHDPDGNNIEAVCHSKE